MFTKEFSRTEKKNLAMFFAIAFGWSWFFWLLQSLGLNLYLAPFGPFVAAFTLTYINERSKGVKDLLKKGFDPRIKKAWYLPVFLLMPTIAGLSLLGAYLVEGVVPELTALVQPWLIVWNFVYMFFLGSPLQEEFGWRGYALPRLQARYSVLFSSAVLGVVWAVWHLPLNFMSGAGPQYEAALPMFLSSVVLMAFMSILFTWIFNNTEGSVFATLLFHTMINLSTYVVFPVFETGTGPAFYLVFTIVVSLAVLAFFGHKRMIREKRW